MRYRDRKGNLTQNVLMACNFDMKFTYLMSGWEGNTADSRLWHEAMASGAVKIPNGKFLLGDAGFPLCDGCPTLYRNVRYHLKEYREEGRSPQTKEKLFNLRHSSLKMLSRDALAS